MGIRETNAVIFNVEADHFRQAAIEFDLVAPAGADLHFAVLPARLVYGLDTVDNHFDNGV